MGETEKGGACVLSGWFNFDGFATNSISGVDVYPADIDTAPARDFNVISAQGRNGDLIINRDRFPNVTRSYWVLIGNDFDETYNALSDALLPATQYAKLFDSWNPDEYYMAYVSAPLQPVLDKNRDMGKVLVTFTRKPQRYLVSGNTPVVVDKINTSTWYTYVTNPSAFAAKPVLEIVLDTDDVSQDTNKSAVICRIGGSSLYYGPSIYLMDLNRTDASQRRPMNELLYGIETIVIDFAKKHVYSPELIGDDLDKYVVLGSGTGNYPSETTKEFPELAPGRQICVYPGYSGIYRLKPRFYSI